MAKKPIPSNAAELEEMFSTRAKVDELFADDQFTDVMKAYAKTYLDNDEELKAQIKEQTELAVANMLGESKVTDGVRRLNQTKLNAAAKRSKIYNSRAVGVPLDGVYDDLADVVRANWHRAGSLKDRAELADKRNKATEIFNSYSSNVPADGGFLIPEVMREEILSVALESSIMRPISTVIPMESLTVKIPMIDDTSHATNVYGGVQAYWTEEAAALVESQGSLGAIKLEAEKLTAYTEYPNELFEDASAFGALLNKWMPEAVAYFEDVAFISGSGAGEPKGFLNANSSVSVAKETGQAADTIVWENIVKMYSRMLPTSLGNAVWIANSDTFPELATMALSVGTGGSAVWLNNGVQGPPMTILGRPVIFTEKVPTVGDAGDINFVDASYYLIGDRQTMQVDVSPHYKFQNDKTALRVIQRCTGRPWLQSALTPRNGSNTLSPFVKLAARA